jgi:hypothetical protein
LSSALAQWNKGELALVCRMDQLCRRSPSRDNTFLWIRVSAMLAALMSRMIQPGIARRPRRARYAAKQALARGE